MRLVEVVKENLEAFAAFLSTWSELQLWCTLSRLTMQNQVRSSPLRNTTVFKTKSGEIIGLRSEFGS